MLGKFTFLFDTPIEIPVLGSSREPVRFHLWVALGVAAPGGPRRRTARAGPAPCRSAAA